MTFSGRLFLASVLTLPLQLNKFFFGEFSYVLGIPIDYRAIAIYLSDIFIVAYLCAVLFKNSRVKPFCSPCLDYSYQEKNIQLKHFCLGFFWRVAIVLTYLSIYFAKI